VLRDVAGMQMGCCHLFLAFWETQFCTGCVSGEYFGLLNAGNRLIPTGVLLRGELGLSREELGFGRLLDVRKLNELYPHKKLTLLMV